MRNVPFEVARVLLEIDVVQFTPNNPVTFKSGIKSPVYVDNRRIPFWPKQWRTIIIGFQRLIETQGDPVDIIAGIETAGIPHSAALAYSLRRPSVFVRKQAKEHGLKGRVEGGDVSGRRVLLVEDLITTGGSSLSGVDALRESGAIVEDCLAIVSYGFKEAIEAFTEAGVRLHTLTSFSFIFKYARQADRVAPETVEIVTDWLRDPHGWAERHGHA
jgi:orotate phosphoribosyltransferase